MNQKLTGDVVREYLEKFPNTPSRTLARMIYRDNVELFRDSESVRVIIRFYRGSCGDKHRNQITDRRFIKNHEVQHT